MVSVTRMARLGAWLAVAFIVLATLAPIGLRPTTAAPVNLERFGAYFVVGILFTIGYPDRRRWILLGLCLGAIFLEASQNLIPTRHGRVADALVKVAGGVTGFSIATGLELALRQRRTGPKLINRS